jgi:hypothetical protein
MIKSDQLAQDQLVQEPGGLCEDGRSWWAAWQGGDAALGCDWSAATGRRQQSEFYVTGYARLPRDLAAAGCRSSDSTDRTDG